MCRRYFVIIIAIVMLVSIMPMAAFAADYPTVTAKVTGNGNNRQVEIIAGGEKATFNYTNGSKSGTYIIADTYEVFVEYSGNSVKSAKVINVINANVVTDDEELVGETGVTEIANNDPQSDLRIVLIEQSWSKTTFHCNITSGNGRVWPEINDAVGNVIFNKKNDGKIILELQEVLGTTKWTLLSVINAKTGEKYDPPVCPGKNEYCGCNEWISFSNNSGVPDGKNMQMQHGNFQPDDPVYPDGSFTIEKTVDNVEFSLWLEKYLEQFDYADRSAIIEELLSGISFKLFTADDKLVGNATLEPGGTIAFVTPAEFCDTNGNLLPGDYYVVEYLTGKAAEVFTNIDGQISLSFTVGSDGAVDTTGFDVNAQYVLDFNNAFVFKLGAEPGLLNGSGEIFPITLWNNSVDSEYRYYRYSSFCANNGSVSFAHNYLVTAKIPQNENEILIALNYIYSKYGSVDRFDSTGYDNVSGMYVISDIRGATRIISQIIVWHLLCDVPLEGMVRNLDSEYINIIQAALSSEISAGAISKLVYLECDHAEGTCDGYYSCQPQIVPLYGEFTFDNETPAPIYPDGSFSIEKTVDNVEFSLWLEKYLEQFDAADISEIIEELLSGISFKLFTADDKLVGNATLEPGGTIAFVTPAEFCDTNGNLLPGDYYVVEYLTGKAAEVFTNIDGQISLSFTVGSDGAVAGGSVLVGPDFRVDSFYPGILKDSQAIVKRTGMEEQFHSASVWQMIDKGNNDELFYAFCGDIDSGVNEYNYVLGLFPHGSIKETRIISALDYINDTFNLDTLVGKMLAQMVIWNIVNDDIISITPNTSSYENAGITTDIIADIVNGNFAATSGRITGIQWLVGKTNPIETQPLIVPVKNVILNNETPPPVYPDGSFSIEKTVDNVEFSHWLEKYLEQFDAADISEIIEELLSGISFKLFTADDKLVGDATLEPGGTIAFVTPAEFCDTNGNLLPGDYYVVEYLTGKAAEVFTNINGQVSLSFTVGSDGNPVGNTISIYTLLRDAYGEQFWNGTRMESTASFFSGGAQIAEKPASVITIMDDDGITYPSFCAQMDASRNAAQYVVGEMDATKKARVLSALNYINNNWNSDNGGLFDTFDYDGDLRFSAPGYGVWDEYHADSIRIIPKIIASLVVWQIIDDSIDYIVPQGNTYARYEVTAEYLDTIVNNISYENVTGEITDVLFLVGYNDPTTQPLITPVRSFSFNNKTFEVPRFQGNIRNDQRVDVVTCELPLGHDWMLSSSIIDGLECMRCGDTHDWWDLDEELLNLYYWLGGQGDLTNTENLDIPEEENTDIPDEFVIGQSGDE